MLVESLSQFNCEPKEYNELASLFFVEQNVAIRHLFHLVRDELGDSDIDSATFSTECLVVFFSFYIVMAVVTYGLAVPSGLFVPSLLSGAAFGRLCINLLHRADAQGGTSQGTFSDAGTYALIGAVAVLGGMARMTISLTVIMLEATGDMQYVLPLMITLTIARVVGNAFNHGLYDIHIRLNGLPLLEPECPGLARQNDMCVREVMSRGLVTLQPVMTAGDLFNAVRSNEHGCYPVSGGANKAFQGTVARHRLAVLFMHKAFGDSSSKYHAPGAPDGAPGTDSDGEQLSPAEAEGLGEAIFQDAVANGTGDGGWGDPTSPVQRKMSVLSVHDLDGINLYSTGETELMSPLVKWPDLEVRSSLELAQCAMTCAVTWASCGFV